MRKILLTAPIGWHEHFSWPLIRSLPIKIISPIYGLDFLSENLKTTHALLRFPLWNQYVALLKRENFTDVGISYLINHINIVKEMVETTRRLTNVNIVGGGHGVFSQPEFAKQMFDDACVGWGVEWMKEWLQEPIDTPPYRLPVSDMVIPLNSSKYFNLLLKMGLIVGNVGCPLGCEFCQITREYPKYIQAATPAQAVSHMVVHKRPVYFFQDDNFFLHKKWIEEFILQRTNYEEKTPWLVWGSLNLLKNYDINDLSKNGLLGVYIGYERSDHQKSHLAEEITEELRNNDILILGSFIFGWKDQTKADIEREIEWALSLKCDAYFFACYTPLPGTTGWGDLKISMNDIEISELGSGEKLVWKHPNIEKEWLTNKIQEAYKSADINRKRILQVLLRKVNHPFSPVTSEDMNLIQAASLHLGC